MTKEMRSQIIEMVELGKKLYDELTCPEEKQEYSEDLLDNMSKLPEYLEFIKTIQ